MYVFCTGAGIYAPTILFEQVETAALKTQLHQLDEDNKIQVNQLVDENKVIGELLFNASTENAALKRELEVSKTHMDMWKKNNTAMLAGLKKRKQPEQGAEELREERKMKEEAEDLLQEETRYVQAIKEAFYTVRLEFEERTGEPAQTLMPKKGGGFEEPRVNDLWAV